MKRIINAATHLLGIVPDGKTFYIGFGIADLTELGQSLPGLKDLINGKITSVLVDGKKGALRDNTKGKMVRKQPESKESIWRHIKYYSKRFEKEIEYDREFHIWEKEILHKYNLALEVARTPQNETILHFPAFKMIVGDETLYLKAGAAMNMCIALGSYFLPYNNVFEPFVPVTKFEHRKILASGEYTVSEKLDLIDQEILLKGDSDIAKGNSYRFALLKERHPGDVTMGLGGFDEYLMFEFPNDDLMILENLKTGNATFVFKLSIFDKNKHLDKQTVRAEGSFLKRIVHSNLEDWHKKFSQFFHN